jgi:hypothetical protein
MPLEHQHIVELVQDGVGWRTREHKRQRRACHLRAPVQRKRQDIARKKRCVKLLVLASVIRIAHGDVPATQVPVLRQHAVHAIHETLRNADDVFLVIKLADERVEGGKSANLSRGELGDDEVLLGLHVVLLFLSMHTW